MLRRLSITALLAVGALTATAQAGSSEDGGRLAVRDAWVKVSACSANDHNATFYARMRRLAPGQRLAMRFTLLEQGGDGAYIPVDAPGLNRWRKSKPEVKAFAYRQRVRGLAPESAYRVRVDYRWYAADGEIARRGRHRSGVCDQSPPLPNLRARIVGSAPTETAGVRLYRVRVANSGRGAAPASAVRLSVDDAPPATRALPKLPPGGVVFVHFRSLRCAAMVRAEADSADEIGESSEADNSHDLACADVPQTPAS